MPLPLSVPPGVFDTDQTNLRPHTPKWREVCSISHTNIETPTSGSGRGQKSDIISNVRKMKCSRPGQGRAHQPPQRRQMDLGCHHLGTI